MNSDIRLSLGFFDHPKIIKLERQLGLEGVMALIRLWLWTAQNRPSGVLTGMDEEDIAIVARWKGEATAFNAVVTELKLLDKVNGVYQIHNWQEHNTWQSDAENRSNASRLSRMAKTHPELYKLLEDAGIKGISKEVYGVITTSNDPKAAVERLLTKASSLFSSSPYLFSSSPCSSLPFSAAEPDDLSETQPETLPEDTPPARLAMLMRDTLKAHLPTFREPNLPKWAQSFAMALRNDERMKDPSFVAEVIKWACSDAFWRANIHSPDKLREKFDQLTAKMEFEAEKARTAAKAETWKSPASRRVEANQKACREAEHILFGDTSPIVPDAMEVSHDAS